MRRRFVSLLVAMQLPLHACGSAAEKKAPAVQTAAEPPRVDITRFEFGRRRGRTTVALRHVGFLSLQEKEDDAIWRFSRSILPEVDPPYTTVLVSWVRESDVIDGAYHLPSFDGRNGQDCSPHIDSHCLNFLYLLSYEEAKNWKEISEYNSTGGIFLGVGLASSEGSVVIFCGGVDPNSKQTGDLKELNSCLDGAAKFVGRGEF